MSELFDRTINAICAKFSLPLRRTKEDCILLFDGYSVQVTFDDELELMSLATEVGKAPVRYPENLLIEILHQQFGFAKTGGATLALCPDDETILQQLQVPVYNIDVDSLTRILENFLDTADYWKETIQTKFREDAIAAAAAGSPSAFQP